MDVRRISPALTTEQKLTVVTLAEAKMQARVSHSFEDSLITSFIAAATHEPEPPSSCKPAIHARESCVTIRSWARS